MACPLFCVQYAPWNCTAEEFTMTAKEPLRSILEATDPDDCDDAAVRKSLNTELGVVLAMCPPVAEPTADDGSCFSGFCVLRTDRRLTEACQDCLISEVS